MIKTYRLPSNRNRIELFRKNVNPTLAGVSPNVRDFVRESNRASMFVDLWTDEVFSNNKKELEDNGQVKRGKDKLTKKIKPQKRIGK